MQFPHVSVQPSKERTRSESFLLSKHNSLNAFDTVEDLATGEYARDEGLAKADVLSAKEREAVLHHVLNLRVALSRELWQAGIYVGKSVLDDFVLEAAKSGKPDICARVLDALREAGAGRTGFVVFPLTKLGMELPGYFPFKKTADFSDWAAFKQAGFAVTAQVGSVDAAFSRLSEMAAALGVQGWTERESFEHHVRSGSMKWMKSNPLLLLNVTSHTGSYYENQFVFTLKIRMAASLMVMLHALGREQGHVVSKFDSSAETSNFETLDIRHYLAGEATFPDRPLCLRRVPMNVGALELAQLSDLPVTLSSRMLQETFFHEVEQRLTPLLRKVEDGYMRYINLQSKERVHKRVFARLVTALDWYRRSFSSRMNEAEATVSLAVAFETLLTDFYAPGSLARLQRRVGICLGDHPNCRTFQDSVTAVHMARSQIVHTGSGERRTETASAQGAFALCFLEIASRLGRLHRKMAHPPARTPRRHRHSRRSGCRAHHDGR